MISEDFGQRLSRIFLILIFNFEDLGAWVIVQDWPFNFLGDLFGFGVGRL
jgi:hypothetical protein